MFFFIELFAFALALWLGLYLLAREGENPCLSRAGAGLVAYACTLALGLVLAVRITPILSGLYRFFLFVPALFWVGALLALWPDESVWRQRLDVIWRYGLLPTLVAVYASLANGQNPPWLAGWVGLPLLVAFGLTLTQWRSRPRPPFVILFVATLFFSLGGGLLLIPLAWLIRPWLVLALGIDLVVLGLVIGRWDALKQGEAFWPDFIRSFDIALGLALLFGGQVGLVIALETGKTYPMLILLLTTIAAAIILTTLNRPLQMALERFTFAAFPRIRQERADLYAAAEALPRTPEPGQVDWSQYDDESFARLTRRALSHLGNLPRLATSPLIQLPVVTNRLTDPQAGTLERARLLQLVLIEQITRLKPTEAECFGTTDAWRHYNALYFPYVVGLKPYSRRTEHVRLDEASQQALRWLQSQVPERTLYNWQNAAAQLIASALRSG